MENASKALLLAGGVIMALMVAAIGVYIYDSFNKTAESYSEQLKTAELHNYNSKFDVYIDRTDITAQEIISIINIAQEKRQGTKVYINSTIATDWTESQKNNFLARNILKYTNTAGTQKAENLFKYVDIKYTSSGKVSEIKFEEN